MAHGADPVALDGFADQRVLITPTPVPEGVVLARQDGTVAAFDLIGRPRWDVDAVRPGTPPVSSRLITTTRGGLLLDDREQWSGLDATDGAHSWGPVPFGSLLRARRGPDDRYVAYVGEMGAVAVAALDPATGEVAGLGVRPRRATVASVRTDHLLAVEGTDLVRLDVVPDGLAETWRESPRRTSPGGSRGAVDAAGLVEVGPLIVVPLVGYGLVAFDHDGGTAWEVDLGEYSAPAVAVHEGILHVLSEQYLQIDAASGGVLRALDLVLRDGPRLGQVHSPRVHGGSVFGADAAGLVYRVDLAAGEITWWYATQNAMPRACGLALGEGQLWALDLSGRVYGFRLG